MGTVVSSGGTEREGEKTTWKLSNRAALDTSYTGTLQEEDNLSTRDRIPGPNMSSISEVLLTFLLSCPALLTTYPDCCLHALQDSNLRGCQAAVPPGILKRRHGDRQDPSLADSRHGGTAVVPELELDGEVGEGGA